MRVEVKKDHQTGYVAYAYNADGTLFAEVWATNGEWARCKVMAYLTRIGRASEVK